MATRDSIADSCSVLLNKPQMVRPEMVLRFETLSPIHENRWMDTRTKKGGITGEYYFNAREVVDDIDGPLKTFIVFKWHWDSIQGDLKYVQDRKRRDIHDTSSWMVRFKQGGDPVVIWD